MLKSKPEVGLHLGADKTGPILGVGKLHLRIRDVILALEIGRRYQMREKTETAGYFGKS